ncbi:M81 family metallopeptidase [Lachnospiraceae bacterium 62-35]
MKILMAGFYHESNTFSPLLTKKEDFITVEKEELLEYFPGAVLAFQKGGAQIVTSIYTGWMSSGVIEEEAFRYYVNRMLEDIKGTDDLDGIWLQLHGAIYVENIGCGELFLLRKIRMAVGNRIPIAIAFDPHGNISPDLTDYADILRAYHTAPHEDQQDTYRVTAEALMDFVRRGIRIKPAYVRLPMLMCGDSALTRDEPLKTVIARCKKLEQSKEIETACFFISMHSANTENTYPCVVIVPSSPEYYQYAMDEAREIAHYVYDRRHQFHFEGELVEPQKALEMAMESSLRPVIISDSGDNTTAGTTGMNTVMLKYCLERDFGKKKVLVSTIYDAKACHELMELQEGASVDIMLGAGVDDYSQPVPVKGILKAKGRTLLYLPMRGNTKPIGHMVTVSCGSIDITITDVPDSFTDMDQCKAGSFDASEYDIIIVKQAYHFPDLVKLGKQAILALTPGYSYMILEDKSEVYTKLPWTIYPFQS